MGRERARFIIIIIGIQYTGAIIYKKNSVLQADLVPVG